MRVREFKCSIRFGSVGIVCFFAVPLWSVPAEWFGYQTDGSQSSGSTTLATGASSEPPGSQSGDLLVTANATTSLTSPTGQPTYQGYCYFIGAPGTSGSSWIRVELLSPLSSSLAGEISNSPFMALGDADPTTNVVLGGSEFTSLITAQASAWPLSFITQIPTVSDRGSPGTPIRLGFVLADATGQQPPAGTAWPMVNTGSIENALLWTQASPIAVSFPEGITALLGSFVDRNAPADQQVTCFKSLFIPTGTTGGEFYLYPAGQSFSSSFTFGSTGDAWAIFNGDTSVLSGAVLNVGSTTNAGIFEFLGDLSVAAGAAVENFTPSPDVYNTTIVLGSSNTFSGPGTMSLGTVMAQSANWLIQQGTITANLGGPTFGFSDQLPAVTFYPLSVTTVAEDALLSTPANMVLREDATLRGLGTVTASTGFTAEGRIRPGAYSQLGTLSMLGTPLTMQSTGEILTRVTPLSHSRLTLDTAPTLGGTLRILTSHAPGFYREGERFIVLSAPSFSGNFQSVETPGSGPLTAFLEIHLEVDPTTYTMVVGRYQDYADTCCTPNECAVACSLDCARLSPETSPALKEALASVIDQFTLGQVDCGCIWAPLSGEEFVGVQVAGVQIGDILQRSLQWEIWRGQDAWALSPVQSTTRSWIDAQAGQQKWWGEAPYVSYVHHERGVLVGVDTTYHPRWLLGGAFHTFSSGNAWEELTGTSHHRDIGGSLYAGWSRPDRYWIEGWTWYGTASLSGGGITGSLDRTPLCLPEPLSTVADFSGYLLAGRAEAGARIHQFSSLIQPYLALTGTQWHRGSFCESTCGPDLGLRGCEASQGLLSIVPGLRVAGIGTTLLGSQISPEMMVEVSQRIAGNSAEVFLNFEGSPCECGYRVHGQNTPATTYRVGLGLQLLYHQSLNLQLWATQEGGRGFSGQSLNLEAGFQF